MRALQHHAWPGNIRELQNVLRNVVLFHGRAVTAAMLARLDAPPPAPGDRNGRSPRSCAWTTNTVKPLWKIEKEAIEDALAVCGGNVPRAAAFLEINPSTIYRRKAEWDKERLASLA